MPKKYTTSDQNASRTAMPGTKRQVPTTTSTVRTARGEKVADVKMNYGGVAGGLPTGNASQMRANAKAATNQKASASAKASTIRAENLEGHDRMTMAAKSSISMMKSQTRINQMKADRETYDHKTTARRPKK